MTPSARRLAALAAALAPERCRAFADKLGDSLAEAGAEAVRLARLPRSQRVRALAAALGDGGGSPAAEAAGRGTMHAVVERLAREARHAARSAK